MEAVSKNERAVAQLTAQQIHIAATSAEAIPPAQAPGDVRLLAVADDGSVAFAEGILGWLFVYVREDGEWRRKMLGKLPGISSLEWDESQTPPDLLAHSPFGRFRLYRWTNGWQRRRIG